MSPIEFETRGHCAVITMNRPEARNAVSPEIATSLEAAVDRLEDDPDLRVGVLAGVGPVFCAGADLKAVAAGRGAELSTDRGGFGGLVRRARSKPLIAAVEGPALAGGTELVLACDLVVASSAASFGLPEVKRGLIAAGGGLIRLWRHLPPNLAMELALTGEALDVESAYRHGLVNRLCGEGEALTAALELAGLVTANAPIAVRLSRRVMLELQSVGEERGWDLCARANAQVLASEDVQEGILAFTERRVPAWSNR